MTLVLALVIVIIIMRTIMLVHAEDHWAKDQEIIIDASRARNCLALINDAKGFLDKEKKSNVMSFQVSQSVGCSSVINV